LPVSQDDIPIERQAPYMVCVRIGCEPETWWAYPLPLRSPLSDISIPLRETDKPIVLKLQQQIDRVYVAGGHDDIDYSRPLDPPLLGDDAVWARQLLANWERPA